ncbi:MAG: hypothetical protein CML69_08625 [Rhodobacteraceae bacterium]|nr:hypothetical protein [Paracoccaceae bacterium]
MSYTVFITTPCLDSISTIDRTILSVATQAGDFFIRYHIQDGGSTDGTLDRLLWWQRRLASEGFPIQCLGIQFTFDSSPDKGMYDALCKGFDAMRIPANSFMTWINADDMLAQGALAFVINVERQFTPQQVSWIGGATSVIRDDTPLLMSDNPIPKAAIKAGLCDGVHWNFLQQEGTFFRRWLWASIKPDQTIRPMKLAGDWNLWRLFAERSSLVQSKFVLGSFRIQEGQLSARLREKYMAEIDSVIPEKTRKESLKTLGANAAVIRRVFATRYGDGRLSIIEEDRGGMLEHNHMRVFDSKPKKVVRLKGPRTVAEGVIPTETAKPLEEIISFKDNILAYDHDWQFPAVTEQHAYHQLRDLGAVPDGVVYVAYPWANLIDKLQTNAFDAHVHMAGFQHFCRQLPAGSKRVTVCQHIKMKDFMYLFEEAGIEHIFWTHATQDDRDQTTSGISLEPFPLYPVQVTAETDADASAKRPHLFSFIGAKSNQYYLTNSRELILDLLKDHPRGMIIGRDSWHYNKVVYEHQILKTDKKDEKKDELVNQSASDQFKESLAQSIFSLCPAGSGPNSIRLWESLGAGSIPVILADTYATPGNQALWQEAAVFCKETPEAIKALPARLEAIAKDPANLAKMRHAMRQLWILYGPHSFVYDVQVLMLKLAGQAEGLSPEGVALKNGQALPPLRERLLGRVPPGGAPSAPDAQFLLRTCSSDLLLDGADVLPELSDDTPLGQVVILSQEVLGRDHPVVQHYQRVVIHVRAEASTKPKPIEAAPMVNGGKGPKICLFGRHSNRTPLSYAPFQRVAGDRITLVDDMMQADMVMTGFNLDIRENAESFEKLAKERADTKVVVISEEPLWDSTWSGGFVGRNRKAKCGETDLAYTFLNHSNSTIFDFEKIPYFLLTSEDFLARYGLLISRHSDITPANLLKHWEKAAIPAAFYAEVRDGENYAKAFPEHGVYGLSTYRTQVARKVGAKGTLREGKGWRTDAKRQALPDWHLDKLAALDMRVRVASSFENTHQKSYISEKIFDAFVVGGIPTYYADKEHQVLTLVPETSMINTFGLSAEEAAKKIETFKPDAEFAKSWLETARSLQATFTDEAAVVRERQRVVDTIMDELEKL